MDKYKKIGLEAMDTLYDIKSNITDGQYKSLCENIKTLSTDYKYGIKQNDIKVQLCFIVGVTKQNDRTSTNDYNKLYIHSYTDFNYVDVEMPILLYKEIKQRLKTEYHIDFSEFKDDVELIGEDKYGIFDVTNVETDIFEYGYRRKYGNWFHTNLTRGHSKLKINQIYIIKSTYALLYKMNILDDEEE